MCLENFHTVLVEKFEVSEILKPAQDFTLIAWQDLVSLPAQQGTTTTIKMVQVWGWGWGAENAARCSSHRIG